LDDYGKRYFAKFYETEVNKNGYNVFCGRLMQKKYVDGIGVAGSFSLD